MSRRLRPESRILASVETLRIARERDRIGRVLIHQDQDLLIRRLDRTAQLEEPRQSDLLFECANRENRKDRGA